MARNEEGLRDPRTVSDSRAADCQRDRGAVDDPEGTRSRIENNSIYFGIGRERNDRPITCLERRIVTRTIRHGHRHPIARAVPITGRWVRRPRRASGRAGFGFKENSANRQKCGNGWRSKVTIQRNLVYDTLIISLHGRVERGLQFRTVAIQITSFLLHLLVIASLGGAETESLDAMLAKTFGVSIRPPPWLKMCLVS